MLSEEDSKVNSSKYYHGIFDKYFEQENCDRWGDFPETMWELGFVMDSGKSFFEFKDNCGLKLKVENSRHCKFRNYLYVLENASLQIVGNCVFSYWRYLTHQTMGWDKYDEDFLRRALRILENKFEEKLQMEK